MTPSMTATHAAARIAVRSSSRRLFRSSGPNAVTALLLSFAIQAYKRFGTLDPQELAELKG